MLSSNYYIESGIYYIDCTSNCNLTNLLLEIEISIKSFIDMLLGLQNDQAQEIQSKLDSVVFMTVNYYKKQNLTVQNISLINLTDTTSVESVLVARQCESSYQEYMDEVEMMKQKYALEPSIMDFKHFSKEQWTTIVEKYNEANKEILHKTNVYVGIRNAFMFGNGIRDESVNFDETLLVSKFLVILCFYSWRSD